MNNRERQAIVWDTIERLAFQPNSDNECSTWLGVYAKTLHNLWGMEPRWNHFKSNDNFNIAFLNLNCDYQIENADKYAVSLQNSSTSQCDTRQCDWQSHIDSMYLSKASLHSANARYPHQQLNELEKDVETVLDGMLFHPRCHTHLEDIGVQHVQLDQDNGGLSSHEVRIGGGIENPYIFLFHLRYQCCLVADQVRQDERQRLINLFDSSIRGNTRNVSACDLCDY